MISSRFRPVFQIILLIGSVFFVSACATTNSSDDKSRIVLEKGKFDTPPVLSPQNTSVKSNESNPSVVATSPESLPAHISSVIRINPKESFVNVRSAPSTKSRVVAVLKGGQLIEVLETKDSWIKVKWLKGEAVKQGWMKKLFVEGFELSN